MSCNKALLGSYIEQIDRRNSRLEYGVEDVMGITNTKVLMETKARPEYADLSKFYILEPGEFIYNPRTSRNGEKVGMAYNDTNHNILFTFNNIPFCIKPECRDYLDPDYLYLFFLNPEFDRYARYNSWGSATELFPWEEMCRIPIPVPPISSQRKIVHDYKVVMNRIELLRKVNVNLDSLVSCLFEKTIESSSDACIIASIGEFVRGSNITSDEMIPGEYDVISAGISPSGKHNTYNVTAPSITISGSGVNAGYVAYHFNNIWAADCSYNNDSDTPIFLFYSLKKLSKKIETLKDGNSAQPHVYAKDINALNTIAVSLEKRLEFEQVAKPFFDQISLNLAEIKALERFSNAVVSCSIKGA